MQFLAIVSLLIGINSCGTYHVWKSGYGLNMTNCSKDYYPPRAVDKATLYVAQEFETYGILNANDALKLLKDLDVYCSEPDECLTVAGRCNPNVVGVFHSYTNKRTRMIDADAGYFIELLHKPTMPWFYHITVLQHELVHAIALLAYKSTSDDQVNHVEPYYDSDPADGFKSICVDAQRRFLRELTHRR